MYDNCSAPEKIRKTERARRIINQYRRICDNSPHITCQQAYIRLVGLLGKDKCPSLPSIYRWIRELT